MFYLLFFLVIPPPPRSTLFPYTTLFRSIFSGETEILWAAGKFAPMTRWVRWQSDGWCNSKRGAQGSRPREGACRSEEHTSELQSHVNLVCRLLLEKKKKRKNLHCNTDVD